MGRASNRFRPPTASPKNRFRGMRRGHPPLSFGSSVSHLLHHVTQCWTKDVIRRYGWSAEKLTASGIPAVSRCVNPLPGAASSGRARWASGGSTKHHCGGPSRFPIWRADATGDHLLGTMQWLSSQWITSPLTFSTRSAAGVPAGASDHSSPSGLTHREGTPSCRAVVPHAATPRRRCRRRHACLGEQRVLDRCKRPDHAHRSRCSEIFSES